MRVTTSHKLNLKDNIMKSMIINSISIEFKDVKGEYFTDSITISKVFGKVHHDMIQAMKRRDKGADFNEFITDRQITVSEYKDSTGRTNPLYLFDRDAFSFFVMGFTGAKSSRWKRDYIKAFNEMEKEINSRATIAKEELEYLKRFTPNQEFCELGKNDLAHTEPCRGSFRTSKRSELSVEVGRVKALQNITGGLFDDYINKAIEEQKQKIKKIKAKSAKNA
jgi:Rha family phage regulatory protein